VLKEKVEEIGFKQNIEFTPSMDVPLNSENVQGTATMGNPKV
jgi:hypothetical protein